jgi:hypothetical protein
MEMAASHQSLTGTPVPGAGGLLPPPEVGGVNVLIATVLGSFSGRSVGVGFDSLPCLLMRSILNHLHYRYLVACNPDTAISAVRLNGLPIVIGQSLNEDITIGSIL